MITQDSSSQSQMTPVAALAMLKAGNERFVSKRAEPRDLLAQVEATRGGQWPYAVVLSCIDSRAPAELVLDTGIGDIFNVRIAGNFVNTDILGSMEFAAKLAGAKVVVVMGHESCGAVKGACDGAELGNLTAMLGRLKPAVDAVAEPADKGQRNSGNAEFVHNVARKNVELTMAQIRLESPVLRELEDSGAIDIVGAMYDVATGKVDFWS